MKNLKVEHYRSLSSSILHMWDKIRAQEGLSLILKIIYFAESLPTTSAGVEQSFSQVKLFKSDIRNRLQESTLEGLIFIFQEYTKSQTLSIDERIINSFNQVKKEYNIKKVAHKKSPTKIYVKPFEESKMSEFNQEKPDNQIAADELDEDDKCFSRCSSNQSLSGDYLYPLMKRVKES